MESFFLLVSLPLLLWSPSASSRPLAPAPASSAQEAVTAQAAGVALSMAGADGVINVRDHGAKGDGITDDTTAIQATIDAAHAAGGGVVFFPWTMHYYLISRNITVYRNITLLGQNHVRIHRPLLAGATRCIFVSNVAVDNVRFEGLRLTMAAPFEGADMQMCIHIEDTRSASTGRVVVEDCEFDGAHYGVYVAHPNDLTVEHCRFANMVQKSGGTAAYGVLATNGVSLRVRDCNFAPTVHRHSIYTTDMNNVDISGCTICGSVDPAYMPTGYEYAVKLYGVKKAARVSNCTFYGGLPNIFVDGDSKSVSIIGNTFRGSQGVAWVGSKATLDRLYLAHNDAKCIANRAGGLGLVRFSNTTANAELVLVGNYFSGDNDAVYYPSPNGTIQAIGNTFEGGAAAISHSRNALRGHPRAPMVVLGNRFIDYYRVMDYGAIRAYGNSQSGCTYWVASQDAGSSFAFNSPDVDHTTIATRTVVKTIGVDHGGTDDYLLDNTAANTREQVVTLTNILPAYAELVAVQLRCFETVTGSTAMRIGVGTTSGGDEILTAANTDSANDVNMTPAGKSPKLAATNAARSVYVNFTPGANWNTLRAGQWAILLTYVDNGAAYRQRNP